MVPFVQVPITRHLSDVALHIVDSLWSVVVRHPERVPVDESRAWLESARGSRRELES